MQQLLDFAGRAYAYACPPPFGILNPIHRIALRAQPLTPDLLMWFNWLVLPLVPLVLISYLLVGGPKDKLARESRPIRAALAVAGWTMLTHSFLTRRFTTLLKDPVVDPWMALGRPRWVAAIDLAINLRHVYLGSVGLDTSAGPPNLALPELKPGERPQVEVHLRHWRRQPRPTTRLAAFARHLGHFLFIYCLEDALFTFVRAVGPDALAPPGGRAWLPQYDHIVPGLIAETRTILLPSTIGYVVPPFYVGVVLKAAAPMMIWGMLSGVYHLGAILCIGSGFWEPETWDTDMFDAPFRSTSLRDLVSPHVLNCTKTVIRVLHLPSNTFTFYGLIYLFSGLLHALGQISNDPPPQFSGVILFFLLAGLGNALEVMFKRVTGRFVGTLILNAWVDPGWAACSFFPDKGFGQLVVPYMLKHGLTLEPLHGAGSAIAEVVESKPVLAETFVKITAALAESVVESAVESVTTTTAAVIETVVAVAADAAAEL
ncbi:hypothetical protein A1Q2_02454 [Trichosporon asahii var. asahii CBS 8904]|uniref:Wax synthase domain-containing protein n=1 Tax=Trichosporon asahii var. asahii (strain CBS 8904) TaxID=1220162 RepID=K1W2W0_TRIAC|nr:hypothetical protein A1Q2_02454 [Trichosporon asahii var. asahii CBS 8904]